MTTTRSLTLICPSAADTEAEDQEQKGKKHAEEPDQEEEECDLRAKKLEVTDGFPLCLRTALLLSDRGWCSMNRENQLLVADEPVEVHDFGR